MTTESHSVSDEVSNETPRQTHKPNQVKRDIRAHERLIGEEGMKWSSELFFLAARKLFAMRMADGQAMPASVGDLGNKDIEAFDIAHAAFIARERA